jgi:Tol biopolymer transport system component
VPESWSPKGDVFLFSVTREATTSLWTYSLRERQASPFGDVTSTGVPTNAMFSPDGRWIAYQPGDTVTTTYVRSAQIHVVLNWFEELMRKLPASK